MTTAPVAIAAIRFGDGDKVDDMLESVARAAQARGYSIAGCLQRETPERDDCCAIMFLEDIATGGQLRISQMLGRGSRGCRLDPQALAAVTGEMLVRLDADTDLLVLNRFGKGEADGHGLRAVIEAACALGIPVITAVRAAYEPAWNDFTGGVGTVIDADAERATDWMLAAIAERRRALAAA